MINLVKQVVRLLVFGNVWVSFAAVCLYWETALLHDLKISVNLSACVFGATLFTYNYHRLFRKNRIYNGITSPRHQWILDHTVGLTVLAIFGGVLSVIAFLPFLSKEILLRFAPFAWIAVFYVIPVIKWNGVWRRLRDLPFLKVGLVSAVWAATTVLLPFLCLDPDWQPTAKVWLTFTTRFVFIFAITIPFDVRDMEQDRSANVLTFASQFGIDGIKQVSRILMLGVALAGFAGYWMGWYSAGQGLGLLCSAAGTGWLISGLNAQSDEWFYSGFLDGSMIDQLFWVWLLGLFI